MFEFDRDIHSVKDVFKQMIQNGSVKLADKSDNIRFWATNHLSTAANPNVTSNIPCGRPRVWRPCFSHKLKHSRRAKTSEFQTNLHMT